MAGVIEGLLPVIDSILSTRDSIGAVIQPVFFVTRTWSGTKVGEGTAIDEETQMLPSPGLKDFSHDLRLREGGMIQQGDIFITHISRQTYSEDQLRCKSTAKNVQKFIRVGNFLYQPINVQESYVTFNVHLRRLSNQTRYV